MRVILRAEQRLKQNHEDELLLAHLQELYLSVKVFGLILSQEPNRISLSQCRNNWVLFFVMVIYLEKMMERLNSWEQRNIFGTNLSTLNIGLTICGRARWKEAEATRKIPVLYWSIRKRNSLSPSSSRSFRTQLILHYRTMKLIPERFSSSTRITSDVRSIYNPSQIQDWYWEDNILALTDRRYSLQPWIPCTRIIKIQKSLIWPNHVLHRTSKSGKCTKIRFSGSIFSLLNEKDWSSIKQDRTQSSSTVHSQLVVSRKQVCEIWRNHIPESVCVTSTTADDFL